MEVEGDPRALLGIDARYLGLISPLERTIHQLQRSIAALLPQRRII